MLSSNCTSLLRGVRLTTRAENQMLEFRGGEESRVLEREEASAQHADSDDGWKF